MNTMIENDAVKYMAKVIEIHTKICKDTIKVIDLYIYII